MALVKHVNYFRVAVIREEPYLICIPFSLVWFFFSRSRYTTWPRRSHSFSSTMEIVVGFSPAGTDSQRIFAAQRLPRQLSQLGSGDNRT
jgi:hypothetical protein